MNSSTRTLLSIALALCALTMLFSLVSAAPPRQGDAPVVIINQPPSSSTYLQGDIISVESVSASPNGIVQVDLLVDGQVVHTDTVPGDLPTVQFNLIQRWIANLSGAHVITVRATDSENMTGQASINLSVATSPTPIPGPTAIPTLFPTPAPTACILNSRFLADVTVPDNTVFAPGAVFVKTWNIQNSGSCAWDPATAAVFVSGTRMGGGSPTPVGGLQAGGSKQISINFVAPTTPGTYRSTWKLQTGSGGQFGTLFYVQIVIPGAPTPVPPPPPTPILPIGGCQGTPQITSFTVDNSTIQKGQSTTLRWGFVGNADSVVLNTPNGSGGVPTPGSTGISPRQTQTYTLVAYCKGNPAQAQVTVNVNGGGGGGGGASGSINGMNVGNQGGGKWQARIFYNWNGQGGPAEVCATAQNSSSNPCTNARPNAPYAVLNLQGRNIGKVTACLYDRNGKQVACGSS